MQSHRPEEQGRAPSGRGTHRRVPHLVDVHCHCLPGLDDGPGNLQEALDLCQALAAQKVHTVIATPHQLGRYEGRCSPADIRAAVDDLNKALTQHRIGLRVLPGAEVRVDERIPMLIEQDRILTLGDRGQFVLLELPYEAFMDIGSLLAILSGMGIHSVLAHPERNSFLASHPHYVMDWADFRPIMQVNASSLVGAEGPKVQQAAQAFLDLPLEVIVASDAHHARTRPPHMTAALQAMGRQAPDLARRAFGRIPWQIAGRPEGDAVQGGRA